MRAIRGNTVGLSTPRPRSVAGALFGVFLFAYILFWHTSLADRLAHIVRLAANTQRSCTYIQPPAVSIFSATSIILSWRSSCKLKSPVVECGTSSNELEGGTKGDIYSQQHAWLVEEGPLSSWFQYTSVLPITRGQHLQYRVKTGNAALDTLPPAMYHHSMSHSRTNSSASLSIGMADLSAMNKQYVGAWSRDVQRLFWGKRLSFVIDTNSAPKDYATSMIEGIPNTSPPAGAPSFAGWYGNVCVLFANTGLGSMWKASAASACHGAHQSVVIANMSWTQFALYRLGTLGLWKSQFYIDFSSTARRTATKVAVVRVSGVLRSIETASGSGAHLSPALGLVCSLFGNCIAAATIEPSPDGKLQLSMYQRAQKSKTIQLGSKYAL